MKKLLFLLCATFLLLLVGGSSLLLVLFTGNILDSIRIDQMDAQLPLWSAFLINVGLLALFGLQHSLMARSWFKEYSRKLIPYGLERMVYGWMSALVLTILILFWQPMPIVVWQINIEWIRIFLYMLFFLGWFLVLMSSHAIDGLELSGVRQLASYFLGKEKKASSFKTPILYKVVRHPLYLGFLIAFWATPLMTLSHLLFAVGMTIYILIGIHYEEKNLVKTFGEDYRRYQKTTSKLIPKKISIH